MKNIISIVSAVLFAVMLFGVFVPSAEAFSIDLSYGNGNGLYISGSYDNSRYNYNYGSYVNSILNYNRRPCANRNNLCGSSGSPVAVQPSTNYNTGIATTNGLVGGGIPATVINTVAPRVCPAGTVLESRNNICITPVVINCPAGSVLNGSTCVLVSNFCASGFSRNGICLPVQPNY